MYVSIDGLHPTFNHVISIALFLFGAGMYLYGRRHATQGIPESTNENGPMEHRAADKI
jgi:hypothetical protein